MNPLPRRPLPLACVLVGALALVIAAAPDTAFTAVLSGVLHRSSKAQTLSDWHRLQVVALAVAAISGALGWFGFARWRTIEPALDRLGRALGREDRGRMFDGVLVLVLLGVLHGTSLAFGELRADDYIFLKEAHLPLSDSILLTWGGHVFPLWRVECALLDRLWGPHSGPFRWWLFANVALLAFLQARILAAWRISRNARLVGVVILCGWTQWAQVTMGYWTLSITVKVWIATSIAVLAVIGDGRLTGTRKAIIAVAGLAAILEDTTGAIVVPALVIAAFATGLRDGLPVRVLIRRAAWPIAIAITCTAAFLLGQWLVHLDATPLLGAVGGGSFIHEALYLMGVGTVGMLFAPMVTTQLPPGLSGVIAIVLSAGVAWSVWMAWRRGSREERAPLGHNVALYLFGLAMVVGARPYANYYFMVGWTHYIAFLYVPTAAAIAVAWHEARRTAAWSPALEAQFLLIGCAIFLGAQEAGSLISDRLLLHGGQRWEKRDALSRHAMIALLRDSLFTPLAAVVRGGGTLPQMLGTSLDVRFPNLNPLMPLSFYDETAGIPRGRFRWVAGPNANGAVSDPIDATPVVRMKSVVDPAFRAALHRSSWWRDTYFASTPLEPAATISLACDALRRGADPLTGDAERRHWLLFDVGVNRAAELPTVVNVIFRTDFRPRASYGVTFGPQAHGCVRVELLSLPELALSDNVELLGLQRNSSRRIELVGLFPPAERHQAR